MKIEHDKKKKKFHFRIKWKKTQRLIETQRLFELSLFYDYIS
jgi:hypothetical protein